MSTTISSADDGTDTAVRARVPLFGVPCGLCGAPARGMVVYASYTVIVHETSSQPCAAPHQLHERKPRP